MNSTNNPLVMLVDDDSEALLSLARALKAAKISAEIEIAATPDKALERFNALRPHVVVLDLSLDAKLGPDSGYALLQKFLAIQGRKTRVIVLSGHSTSEFGIKALQLGATSFLGKPADVAHLAALINDAVSQASLMRELDDLKHESRASDLIVGQSKLIEQVKEQVKYAASNTQSVLILGETGTGKGLCAQAIHNLSARSNARLVRYQPSFGSADLVNSDLYGHQKGAFTGALESRRGLLSDADRGTLFLDEIDELPLETQVGLLGVLQSKLFRQLGSNKEERSDFRLICASNADLDRRIKDGKFRSDLFHRINHLIIRLPALRERRDDIEPIAIAVLKRTIEREALNVFEINAEARAQLKEYNWPGNVRELEACIEGAAFRAQYHTRSYIIPTDLSINSSATPIASSSLPFSERVEAYKIALIEEALSKHAGNQVKAAEALGLDRSSMRRILARK